jgi:hypothetical protein|tara:strand:+ start:2658 stop:2861 length:204 start_codon:yes stop_codon:yes gene_type:complete
MDLTQYELLGLAGGLLGTIFKFQRDYTVLTARVISLEKHENEVKELLKELCTGMQDIKILLAEKGIK